MIRALEQRENPRDLYIIGFQHRGNAMNLKQIESEAMDLFEQERAQLAQKLILSLDASSEADLDKERLSARYL